MTLASTASLVDIVRRYRLVEPQHLEELASLHARFDSSRALAGELIQRGWLTPYQANQLLQGHGPELLLGSYVLLARLGEGGMGQVFKARSKLGRIVALKQIRKERLDNPEAIRRFEREVRSAAALSHPNIVHALDADQIGGTHLLVMEYVEGTDLRELVRKKGPFAVAQACGSIQQAARGLQHAFERGMVHRDIKPHNLLLTADGKTVKILDMGLARFHYGLATDGESTTVTQEGMVVGTPDYLAPEQALEPHTVDIRADLYSLGCTFYFLLTGSVPFPGGTMFQKIFRHQFEEPAPVEGLRPEVPPGVAAVVRKLMAKKPEQRFQTPAEVAAALEKLSLPVTEKEAAAQERTIEDVPAAEAVTANSADTLNSPFAALRTEAESPSAPSHQGRKAEEKRLLLFSLAGGVLVLAGLAVALVLAFRDSASKTPAEKTNDPPVISIPLPPASPEADAVRLKRVAKLPAEKQVEEIEAWLRELNPEFTDKVVVKIERGVVTELTFSTMKVVDVSPVRALPELRKLVCKGAAWNRRGRLFSLAPLKGMKLTWLDCGANRIGDLSPLRGMKLTHLVCGNNDIVDFTPLENMRLTYLYCESIKVSDLAPLKGMSLDYLNVGWTPVSNLAPLEGMKLRALHINNTRVSNLAPLKGMPLKTLNIGNTRVSDLSPIKALQLTELYCDHTMVTDLAPLKGMPLKILKCDFEPERDADILRSIKTLQTINGKPAKIFWQDVDAKR